MAEEIEKEKSMRLSLFKSLSKEEQRREVLKSLAEIGDAKQEMNETGTWYTPKTKDVEYKNGGVEYTLWERHSETKLQ